MRSRFTQNYPSSNFILIFTSASEISKFPFFPVILIDVLLFIFIIYSVFRKWFFFLRNQHVTTSCLLLCPSGRMSSRAVWKFAGTRPRVNTNFGAVELRKFIYFRSYDVIAIKKAMLCWFYPISEWSALCALIFLGVATFSSGEDALVHEKLAEQTSLPTSLCYLRCAKDSSEVRRSNDFKLHLRNYFVYWIRTWEEIC